jgi:predicted amidohydrolase YtcJ
VRPGFHDAHTHLSAGAVDAFARLDLRAASSEPDAPPRAAAHARTLPPGAWVRGFGWDHTRWPGAAWPAREALDALLPDRPAFLVRVDGHAAWLIGARPLGARGGREGILLEEAMEAAPREDPRRPSQPCGGRRSARRCGRRRRWGWSPVEDVAEEWAPELYGELRAAGLLTARVGLWLPGDLEESRALALRAEHPPDDPWVAGHHAQAVLDGTLGSRTARTRGTLRRCSRSARRPPLPGP